MNTKYAAPIFDNVAKIEACFRGKNVCINAVLRPKNVGPNRTPPCAFKLDTNQKILKNVN
jgi:hypothetical protein